MEKKYLLSLLFMVCLFLQGESLQGQTFVKVNIDARTVAAMSSEYAAAAFAESGCNGFGPARL